MSKGDKYFIGCDPFDGYKQKNIKELFAPELLSKPEPSWSDAAIAIAWAIKAEKEFELKPEPKLIEYPDLPDNVFYALSANGTVERVTLEWDDVKKKNKVIVKKVK